MVWQYLPKETFVAFSAQRVLNPKLVWGCSEKARDSCEYFAIPLTQQDRSAFDPNQMRTFLAERYGGSGIGKNAGGARCGENGGVQVKGIGRNPLASEGDFFHSYGGASLNEGIAEAIWGEVLAHILPHGATRVLELVTTGTRVPLLAPKPGYSGGRANLDSS